MDAEDQEEQLDPRRTKSRYSAPMGKHRKTKIVASAFGALLTGWGVANHVFDAVSFPENSNKLLEALMSAPQFVPWIAVALCVFALAWAIRADLQPQPSATPDTGDEQRIYEAELARRRAIDKAEEQAERERANRQFIRQLGFGKIGEVFAEGEEKQRLDRLAREEAERQRLIRDATKARPKGQRRDTPLSEALAYAVLGRWGEKFSQVPMHLADWEAVNPPIEQLREAALRGDLSVWGKCGFGTLFEAIPRTYWREHTVDIHSVLLGRASTAPAIEMEDTALFQDLMVNRLEVEKTWPHAG